MKLTLSWLKDHLETSASLQEICNKLVTLGLEVDAVDDPAEKLKGFVVGEVVDRQKHPKADRLSLCQIDDGSGTLLQVVCGAPNVRQGLKIAFAREGTVIPATGQVLKKGVIRDIESQGMVCSAQELKLGEDQGTILELDPALQPGQDLATALGLDDPVIELSITPNRSDCFGIRGIARDLAAAGVGILKPLIYTDFKSQFESPIQLAIEDSGGCQDFRGVFIRGVKNGSAPEKIRHRLESIGQKSINALVDVTNYITFDLGRPLHVFDAKKLHGDLWVTTANGGEVFKALDQKDYTLSKGALILKSGQEIVSLGGIMGGWSSGVTEETTDVFLEGASWDSVRIATTGRDLQLFSEARTRFERGVDPQSLEGGLNAGVHLILDWCGGEASQPVMATHTHGKPAPSPKKTIMLFSPYLCSMSGFEIDLTKAAEILTRLEFQVTVAPDRLEVVVPSFRPDVEGPADLVEEILRLMGYDAIPSRPLPQVALKPASPRKVDVIRRILASRGLHECQTWAFVSEESAEQFGGQAPPLKLENPLSVDLKVMRPSILPNLLSAALRNHNRDLPNSRLFEVASQFSVDGQSLMATGIRSHETHGRHWNAAPRAVDVFDVKADALAVLAATGLSSTAYQIIQGGAPPYYHPGRSGTIWQGHRILGYFGDIHPGTLKQRGMDFPVVGFEIFLDLLPEIKLRKAIASFSNFQPVTRDFAFVVDQKIPAAMIVSTVQKVDKQVITAVHVFDVYAGDKIEPGEKSIAVEVRLEPLNSTLTDLDLQALSQRIITQIEQNTGGKIRE
jgi:phenylalanyl-tRNA synthetase beta chain